MNIYQCCECGVRVEDRTESDRIPPLCCMCMRHPGWMTDPRLFNLLSTIRCDPCNGHWLDKPPPPMRPAKPKGVW